MEATERSGARRSGLAGCEGFGVYGRSARIGVVESVRLDAESGTPALLRVRAGLLGSWRVLVPVEEVEEVSARERRIVLRAGGLLAGPRR
ncbi:MAG TPA: PRC-barrel domain-containing protein [Gaiellaceae bacterium]|nr:PRC-barrel domain-containing protein [Gaiellaceae bacterium]